VVGSRKTQNDSSPSSSEGGTHRESLFHKHDGAPRCGIAAHLTPTLCVDDDECQDAGWLCGTDKGRTCFADHLLAEKHNIQ
jgi:hypothetical protein